MNAAFFFFSLGLAVPPLFPSPLLKTIYNRDQVRDIFWFTAKSPPPPCANRNDNAIKRDVCPVPPFLPPPLSINSFLLVSPFLCKIYGVRCLLPFFFFFPLSPFFILSPPSPLFFFFSLSPNIFNQLGERLPPSLFFAPLTPSRRQRRGQRPESKVKKSLVILPPFFFFSSPPPFSVQSPNLFLNPPPPFFSFSPFHWIWGGKI